MNEHQQDQDLVKANPPKPKELLIIRILVTFGLLSLIIFVHWFLKEHRMGHPMLYWLLTFALIFKLLRMLHEWYHYLDISVPSKPVSTKDYKIDVLTTFCAGEPKEMIINTLKAMVNISYPHVNYLCDEADDPELKEICKNLGVVHVTRKEKINAKAGNINNALKQANGELCVILDPDHVPIPQFLDRVIPYFEDPQVGYVQCVQAYSNRRESFVALGAAEQTYHFYGPMNMCMNSYGTTQAIGANCTFRRTALDSIGGHAPGLAEDMHTSMLMHAKGWKSLYIPELLTRGLVPSSLSAYYKQQLKWSRGTFDIFFKTFLKNFSKFTWRQKIHYMTVPLYFFYGIIDFINILIPILSLFLMEYPWIIDFKEFIRMIIPLIIITLLIRQYSQRWLMETHERGLHVVGGLLRIGTWWVFSLGFIYTLFNIKVPYIPTPKDDKPQNEWKLCIPNIMAFFLSVFAACYGLSKDWNPYTFFMAGFALVNASILGFIVIMSQQKLIIDIYKGLSERFRLGYVWPVRTIFWRIRHAFYNLVRNESMVLSLVTLFILLTFTISTRTPVIKSIPVTKNAGGFYAGIHLDEPIVDFANSNQKENINFKVVSVYQNWIEPANKIPLNFYDNIAAKGGIAMITWDPWMIDGNQKDSARNVFQKIYNGSLDNYIDDYAYHLKSIGLPVFLRFAQHPDDFEKLKFIGRDYARDYKKAWIYIVNKFRKKGISNVVWVWNPLTSERMGDFYPGNEYVDWIGVTCLNYGYASVEKKWMDFEELYTPFTEKLSEIQKGKQKPVMLTEFGCTRFGGDQNQWIEESIKKISNFKEIKSVVLYNNKNDYKWPCDWRPDKETKFIDWTLEDERAIAQKLNAFDQDGNEFKDILFSRNACKISRLNRNKCIVGRQGKYDLIVNGKPFYIKGIAYNSGQQFEDGDLPLTRNQLLKDFDQILASGANTISRYNPGIYDRNILNVAEEKKLNVLYGFWFEDSVNYLMNSDAKNAYMNFVLDHIQKYKDNKAILGWVVGNDVWNGLGKYYEAPYLNLVRKAYLEFINDITDSIHKADPVHPVITAFGQNANLPQAISDMYVFAPSVDVIGINSYYDEYLRDLDKIVYENDPTRPYLLTEFGARGYWDQHLTILTGDSLFYDEPDHLKGKGYFWKWIKYVEAKKGMNIGGIAYNFRDKSYQYATWSGVSDYQGRLKPSYYYLKKVWTGEWDDNVLDFYAEIIPESDKQYTQGSFNFFVRSYEKIPDGLSYEWYLMDEQRMKFIGNLQRLYNGKGVKVSMPEKPGKYRLYLYMTDGSGKVVTSSYPFLLQKR